MTEREKEKAEAAAAVSAGAGVGGVGGTTVGVLELAAQGSVTAWSASVVIGSPRRTPTGPLTVKRRGAQAPSQIGPFAMCRKRNRHWRRTLPSESPLCTKVTSIVSRMTAKLLTM